MNCMHASMLLERPRLEHWIWLAALPGRGAPEGQGKGCLTRLFQWLRTASVTNDQLGGWPGGQEAVLRSIPSVAMSPQPDPWPSLQRAGCHDESVPHWDQSERRPRARLQ